jgi:hypothetical protein
MKRDYQLWIAAMIWTTAMVCGWISLNRYKFTPQPIVEAPVAWPEEAGMSLANDRPTLVMFLHPACPCSKATLAELERLKAQMDTPCVLHLVMVLSKEYADNWQDTPLQRQAAALRKVNVIQDWDGRIADAFSASTSGETYLYSPQGALLYHGGLTNGRGHEGFASGQEQILSALQTLSPQNQGDKVYGCRLPMPTLAHDVVIP